MSRVKRCLSLLLVLVLAVSMVPVPGTAAAQSPAQVDTGNVTVQGTNGFGNLLSAAITQEQAEQEESYGAGYSVTDLEIEGNVATVTYDAMEEAIVIVALYTEDGIQLLTSGKTTVSPEETVAKVTLEGDMPASFQASAYLVDSYDYSPLCQSYDTPMYTREMQELLASTVEDYETDRVLNLDEDKTTNFAVYAETTKIIRSEEGKNTVFSVDEETATYVIKNADEQFTTLKAGDVVAYSYGENELLIVKVKAISVSGTTVTITGDQELEIKEVFCVAKLENIASTGDMTVDESTGDEGITYEGKEEVSRTTYSAQDSGNDTVPVKLKFGIFHDYERQYGDEKLKIRLRGAVELQSDIVFNYYLGGTRQYFELKVDSLVNIELSISGRFEEDIKFPEAYYSPFPGVYMLMAPKIILRTELEIKKVSVGISWTMGCVYNDGIGLSAFGSAPVIEEKLDDPVCTKASVTIAVDLNPSLAAGFKVLKVEISLAKVSLYVPVGIKIDFTLTGTNFENISQHANEKHSCQTCVDIDVSGIIEIRVRVQLGESKNTKFEVNIAKVAIPLGNWYYSVDNNEFETGECPHRMYRLTIVVLDEDGKALYNAVVNSGFNQKLTNFLGVAEMYLPAGKHEIIAASGQLEVSKFADVPKANKVIIDMQKENSDADSILNQTDSEEVEDQDAITSFGLCGYNLEWDLYESGRLEIHGTGDMYDYKMGNRGPWGSDKVKRVYIDEGATSIGNYAFYWCPELLSVTLPDSLTRIGDVAFVYARKLEEITFGKGLQYLGNEVFYMNAFLEKLKFSGDAPEFHSNAFRDVHAVAYYPADNPTWTSDVLQNYGGTITWVPYTSGVGGDEEVQDPPNMTEKASISDLRPGFEIPDQGFGDKEAAVSPNAVYGGEYGTEITQDYTLKTASFTGLVPGGEYLLLALKRMDGEDPLAAENLLFVDQAAAGEDGSLKFTYAQRALAHISYVVACGPSSKDLKDAEITFPEMTADGELQAVDPIVVYDGKTLVEGEDYVLTGAVSFTGAGEYTCYIRGIRKYTGLVTCVYQVAEAAAALGDLNLDGEVDSDDLTLLARHVAGIERVTGAALANADVTGDGEVNSDDLTRHARYVAGIITGWEQA